MRRIIYSAFCLAFLVSCGEDTFDLSDVEASIRVHGLLKDEVYSVAVFVYGPWRSDNKMVTCPNLVQKALPPDDARLERLAYNKVSMESLELRSQVSLPRIPAGEGKVVYVEAYGSSTEDVRGGEVIGNGCRAFVKVAEGGTTSVDIAVYRYPPTL